MEHWQQVVPVPIHHLDYETLIEDTESTCRKLIEFCGLQWSDDCLAYYQHNRPVKTASFWQVRQPVYSSSINKWEKYQPYIGPLLDHFPDIAHV